MSSPRTAALFNVRGKKIKKFVPPAIPGSPLRRRRKMEQGGDGADAAPLAPPPPEEATEEAPDAAPEEEERDDRRCRVCFDDQEEDDNSFISPCKCVGSQKFVHEKCLRAWQRSVQLLRSNHPDQESAEQRHVVCSVCRCPFDVPPPSRMAMLEELSGMSAAQIKPGMLVIATNCHQLPFSPDIPAHWQALFEARRAHWICSVYLVCSVTGGPEAGAGDQVVGVNLTRGIQHVPRLSSTYAQNIRDDACAAQALWLQSAPTDPDLLSLSFYIGGPVAPKIGHALGVVSAEGALAASDYDVSLVKTGANGDALIFGKTKAVIACCAEYGAPRLGNIEYISNRWAGASEPRNHVCVYQGHATWSRQQLLGEITRGSWGIMDISETSLFELHHFHEASMKRAADVANPPLPQDIGRRLWENFVATDAVQYTLHNSMKEEFERTRTAILHQAQTVLDNIVSQPASQNPENARQEASQVASAAVAAAAAIGGATEAGSEMATRGLGSGPPGSGAHGAGSGGGGGGGKEAAGSAAAATAAAEVAAAAVAAAAAAVSAEGEGAVEVAASIAAAAAQVGGGLWVMGSAVLACGGCVRAAVVQNAVRAGADCCRCFCAGCGRRCVRRGGVRRSAARRGAGGGWGRSGDRGGGGVGAWRHCAGRIGAGPAASATMAVPAGGGARTCAPGAGNRGARARALSLCARY